MAKRYDAIIIGTGQAGPPLAEKLAGVGRSVAIIERSRFGGTCVNYGCTPTKTLIASARVAHMARRAAEFGVEMSGPVRVDMAKVKERKDAIAGQSEAGVEAWVRGLAKGAVYRGHATLVDRNHVRVGDDILEAGEIFINVGARAATPPIPGLAESPYLTNGTILDLESVPDHLIVLGGGYVGIEFAQMFRRFGSRVTIIDRARLMAKEDEDVSQGIEEIFSSEGIEVVSGADVRAVAKKGDGVAATVLNGGREREIAGTHLLVALGRKPNTDDLGLQTADIEVDEMGFITVDERLRTSAPGIYAMGDCNGRGAFTHTAYNDHEILAANLLENEDRQISDRLPIYAAFIDPPFARLGMNESEIREDGRRALVAHLPMAKVARARERSETAGFMKIFLDADTEQVLGASLLGIRADEVVHLLAGLMYAGAPYTVLRRAVHIHPTVSELVLTMLGRPQPLEE